MRIWGEIRVKVKGRKPRTKDQNIYLQKYLIAIQLLFPLLVTKIIYTFEEHMEIIANYKFTCNMNT